MKESSRKFEGSALFHHANAEVAAKVAGTMGDRKAKQRHLRDAVESARKAAALSPNLIEFAHLYASLLYDYGTAKDYYKEVIAECELALGIVDPMIDEMGCDGVCRYEKKRESIKLLTLIH